MSSSAPNHQRKCSDISDEENVNLFDAARKQSYNQVIWT